MILNITNMMSELIVLLKGPPIITELYNHLYYDFEWINGDLL